MPTVLQYGATSRTLAEWGISTAILTTRNQDTDELLLTVAVADLFAEPPFAYGGIVQLYRPNGTRFFRGTVVMVRAVGDGQQERYRVTVQNAWWDLTRIVYQQFRAIWNTEFTLLTSAYSSHVTLGQNLYGTKITTNTQIVDIAQYALSQSAVLFAAPTIAELIIPPLQEARDISCAEAIRRQLAYTPDAIVYFDYASAIPVMWIKRRSTLDAVSLDVSAGTIIRGLDSLTPRPDLVPAGVVFTFITQEKDPADPDGPLHPRPTVQTAGATAGPGVIFATIELSLQGGAFAEPVPALLAAHYYSALLTLHWEGTLTLQEAECTGLVRVGNRVHLTNGRAGWATMGAVVQQVAEDLLAGTTQITLGPPEHLGPQDFVALMERWRLNRPTSDFPESQHNGDEGFGDVPENPDMPEVPRLNPRAGTGGGGAPGGGLIPVYTTVDLEVCVNGEEKTARVVGTIF
jgi:hypothetical protein